MFIWIAPLVLLKEQLWVLEQLDHAVKELKNGGRKLSCQIWLIGSFSTGCGDDRLEEAFVGDEDELIQG